MTPGMIALQAVTAHGIAHRLDHPTTINVTDERVSLFCLDGSWSDSIYLDTHTCDPPSEGGWVRVMADGRLPDSGVRVRLFWWETFPDLHPPYA